MYMITNIKLIKSHEYALKISPPRWKKKSNRKSKKVTNRNWVCQGKRRQTKKRFRGKYQNKVIRDKTLF